MLPGQRPKVFLTDLMARALPTSAWCPELLTIQEFTQSVTGNQRLDATRHLLVAYKLYTEELGGTQTFDAFMRWAPTVLQDFNEVDNYRLPSQEVFRNLRDFSDIDQWSFNLDPLSEGQERFQLQWEEMGRLHTLLCEKLKADGVLSGGLLNARAADLLEERENVPWKHVYFAGFNAFSTSEEQFVFGLRERGLATVMWDAAALFVDAPMAESGLFMRKYGAQYGTLPLTGKWSLKSENILRHETASRIAQVKVAAELLAELTPEQWNRSAVILGDETLLHPLLGSLPKREDPKTGKALGFNVTLGFSLRYTPLWDLIMALKDIAGRARGKTIWHRDAQALAHHPALKTAAGPALAHAVSELTRAVERNEAYSPFDLFECKAMDNGLYKALYALLFDSYTTHAKKLDQLLQLFEALKALLPLNTEALEAVFVAHTAVNRLRTDLSELSDTMAEATLWRLLRQALGKEQLNFRGEPLSGLQIMGMLESRTLGFDRVIVVGAAEGHMPRTPVGTSFIPFDLKMHFGLPTRRERDAIYAYYFFRLLQECERVDFIYPKQSDTFGSTEPSRYLGQLAHMLDDAAKSPSPVLWQSKVPGSLPVWEVKQDATSLDGIRHLLSARLSASALNKWHRCPLDFYLVYGLSLYEPTSIDESIDQQLFGSLVHAVLEYLYLDGKSPDSQDEAPLGTLLTKAFLTQCLKDTAPLFERIKKTREWPIEAPRNRPLPAMDTGLNLISIEAAESYVNRFLRWEMQHEEVAEILYLERSFQRKITLTDCDRLEAITLKGNIDRMDRVGGKVRIIDYKTGGVEASKLLFPSDQEKMARPDFDKARQLMIYHCLVEHLDWQGCHIVCGMISFKQLSQGFLPAAGKAQDPAPIRAESRDAFLAHLSREADVMLTPEHVFKHQHDATFCQYCNA